MASPSSDSLRWLCRHIAVLVTGHLRRAGYVDDHGRVDQQALELLEAEDDALAELQAVAIQGKIADGRRRGQAVGLWGQLLDDGTRRARPHKKHCADHAGFSLHAGVRVPAHQRQRLEGLCRYIARPPLAQDRLSRTRSGDVVYRFRKAWRTGAEAVVMDPMTFLSRLAALVPPPRKHQLTYYGVLGPASSCRDRIVPPPPEAEEEAGVTGERRSRGTREPESWQPRRSLRSFRQGSRRVRLPWAELIRRVFLLDVLTCPYCGGRRRVLKFICKPSAIKRILSHLGLVAEAPPRAPPRGVQGAFEYTDRVSWCDDTAAVRGKRVGNRSAVAERVGDLRPFGEDGK